MKAEERKELEQNSLLRWINAGYQDIKAGPNKTAWYVVGGVVVVAALIGGWVWYYYEQQKKNSDIWVKLENAQNTDALQKVAEEHKGTPQANAADLQRARIKLREGLSLIYNPGDYDKASKALELAIELFDRVAGPYEKIEPLLAQELLLGAGKAKEALGQLDDAKTYYGKVVAKDEAREYKDKTTTSVYAVEAQQGIARIEAKRSTLEQLSGDLKKSQ